MEKVLVTGATGRLGMNLVKTMAEKGYETVSFCFDSPAEAPLRKNLSQFETKIVLGDLSTGKGLKEALKGVDSVIHCAALMQEDKVSREQFFNINTKGAFFLMEALREKPVRRLVALTTGAVYDALTAKAPYKEDKTLPMPLSLYGLCKVLNEKIYSLYSYQNNIPAIILRPNYILGGTEPIEVWNSEVLVQVMKGVCGNPKTTLYTKKKEPWKKLEKLVKEGYRWVIPYGPGKKSWKWHVTDVRDVVHGCIAALETKNKNALGNIINIAADKPQKYSEIIPYLAKKRGEKYTEVSLPVTWDIEFDLAKARKLIDYKPRYDYKKMIDDAVRYKNGADTGVIGPGIPH